MLSGSIKYKLDDITTLKFNIEAVDTSTTFYGKISSSSIMAIDLMSGDSGGDGLWTRRFDIGLSRVKVETENYKDSNNKTVKKPVNFDFFCSLGALIRYAKYKCTKKNSMGYTGLQNASGIFTPESICEYNIPLDKKNESDIQEYLGTVSLSLGEIVAMELKTDKFEISIYEDISLEKYVFSQIKNSTPKGFRFNSEYLGVYVAPTIIEQFNNASNGMYSCLNDIIKSHPDKEFEWLLDNNYVIVTDDDLDEVCDYIYNYNDFVYYDTETSGLNITFKSRIGDGDQLVGLILSVKFGESFFFPTQMKSIPNLCGGDHWYFMEHYMRRILEGKDLVAHNMSFDWKVSYIYDINANIVHDTMALFKLTLGAEKENFPMGLKDLARMFLHRDSLELSDLVIDDSWGTSDVRFWDLPYELVRLYACADTDNTKGLLDYAIANDLLHKYNQTKVYQIEIAFSYAVAYQEFYGHKVNTEKLPDLRKEVEDGLKANMDIMESIVGHSFNPNSPKDLVQIMYHELNIPEQISRKTNRVTTNKETLKALSEITDIDGNVKYPFVHYLKEYRTFEGVRKIIDQFPTLATSDGYLFSSVMQYGTTTGRVSINKPNYQSYNNAVKKFIVPRPEFYMTDSDYSSVEYRVLGNMAGNEKIKEGFKDPDFDYHAYQAARMYSVPYSAVTKKLRKAAKGINFGLPYGMGDKSLGIRVFGEESEENTRKAASLRNKYFEGQEDIKDFFEKARAKGISDGYTETYFGRRRYYHRDKFSVNAIRRQAGNQVIQGSAADIYKLAVGRLFKRICKEGWLGKVLFTGFIHDEILCEVSNMINPMVWLRVLREEFEVNIEGWCPLYMGFGFGMSWYEAKSVELPIKLQWNLVDKWGIDGDSSWNGDGYELCKKVPDMLREFSINDSIQQLLDEKSQGEIIKPTLNNALIDILNDDIDVYSRVINDCLQEDFNEVNSLGTQGYVDLNKSYILSKLSKEHITELYTDDNGKYIVDIPKTKNTQEAITNFCKLHSIDRSLINLLDIPEVNTVEVQTSESLEYEDLSEDIKSEADKQRAIDIRVDTLGLYLDTDDKIITLKLVPQNYLNFIQQRTNKNGVGYRVRFKDSDKKMIYETQAYIESEDVQVIQSMYLQYFKSL